MRSDYSLSNLPPVLREALSTRCVLDASGNTHPLHSNVSSAEALDLYSLIRRIRPEVAVETGLAYGISTLAILQALEDNQFGTHHVIDPFQRQAWQGIGLAMIERAGLSGRMVFHDQLPEEVIPHLPEVQFGFIDSSHLFDLTILEFVLIDKKLVTGGVIGLHDLWLPALQRVYGYIVSNRPYRPYTDAVLPNGRSRRLRVAWTRLKIVLSRSIRLARSGLGRPGAAISLPDTPNLAFLQKMEHDTRPWTFHQPF